MCVICERYKRGEISGENALKKMDVIIDIVSNPEYKKSLRVHLLELSELILSKEVPMPESDESLDLEWWNATHGEEK
jgi:hypothetical protein